MKKKSWLSEWTHKLGMRTLVHEDLAAHSSMVCIMMTNRRLMACTWSSVKRGWRLSPSANSWIMAPNGPRSATWSRLNVDFLILWSKKMACNRIHWSVISTRQQWINLHTALVQWSQDVQIVNVTVAKAAKIPIGIIRFHVIATAVVSMTIQREFMLMFANRQIGRYTSCRCQGEARRHRQYR